MYLLIILQNTFQDRLTELVKLIYLAVIVLLLDPLKRKIGLGIHRVERYFIKKYYQRFYEAHAGDWKKISTLYVKRMYEKNVFPKFYSIILSVLLPRT